MPRRAQAPVERNIDACGRAGGKLLLLAALCCLAGGCSVSALKLGKAEIDRSAVTSGLSSRSVSVPPEQLSDELTIRNAVSSADMESLKGAPLPWANAETGSRGIISSLVEEKSADQLCRHFTTSRERFDGVSQYQGQVCMVSPGAWQVKAFDSM